MNKNLEVLREFLKNNFQKGIAASGTLRQRDQVRAVESIVSGLIKRTDGICAAYILGSSITEGLSQVMVFREPKYRLFLKHGRWWIKFFSTSTYSCYKPVLNKNKTTARLISDIDLEIICRHPKKVKELLLELSREYGAETFRGTSSRTGKFVLLDATIYNEEELDFYRCSPPNQPNFLDYRLLLTPKLILFDRDNYLLDMERKSFSSFCRFFSIMKDDWHKHFMEHPTIKMRVGYFQFKPLKRAFAFLSEGLRISLPCEALPPEVQYYLSFKIDPHLETKKYANPPYLAFKNSSTVKIKQLLWV